MIAMIEMGPYAPTRIVFVSSHKYQFFSKTYPDVRQNSETSENLGEIMRHKAFFYGNFPSMTIEESKLNEITNILIVKPMNQVWRSA